MNMSPEFPMVGDAEDTVVAPGASAFAPSDLTDAYPLSPDQVARFQEDGFIKLKHVLSPKTLKFYERVITSQVDRLNTQHLPLEQRDSHGRAFLQVMNIWTKNAVIRDLVFSRKLARLAAGLLGVKGVRLYHDQALYKEPGGDITPWHADQFYWPVDTDQTVALWIPLQDTPLEMGPLAFSPKSHHIPAGRDVAISSESEAIIGSMVRDLKLEVVEEPYELGEVSFHRGWTWLRAGENRTSKTRRAMQVIYIDQETHLIAPRHPHHEADRAAWMPGVETGAPVDSPLNPVLWSAE